MTTLEQAARQALEALEDYRYRGAPFACIPAINALQQALEQKQEPVPVAYSYTTRRNMQMQFFSIHPKPTQLDAETWDIKPLYTEPPQREWVELTDEEVRAAYCTISDKEWAIGGMRDAEPFARAIEAKLKEKNT